MPKKKKINAAAESNIYFPFGRKLETRNGKLCPPVSYSLEPCGWPHMEFKSTKTTDLDQSLTPVIQREEQFDKYSPTEKAIDKDCLMYQYAELMKNLEKSNIGMCCDKIFFDEQNYLKKSVVPRRPNCPKLLRSDRELKIFEPNFIKPIHTRRMRPPSPSPLFAKTKNPFDPTTEELFPKQQPFVIVPNRTTKLSPAEPSFKEFFNRVPDCKPSCGVKSYGCY